MSSEPSNDKELSQESFDNNGFDSDGFDQEGYDYTGFNEYGLDRHDFDRDGKLFDSTEFWEQEDPEESARIAEEQFQAGLLYDRDGYNKDGFEGSGQHMSGALIRERFDD